jgi:hypothetical protein
MFKFYVSTSKFVVFLHLVFARIYELQIFTQENVFDLHSVGGIFYHSWLQSEEKLQILQNNTNLCHVIILFPLVVIC